MAIEKKFQPTKWVETFEGSSEEMYQEYAKALKIKKGKDYEIYARVLFKRAKVICEDEGLKITLENILRNTGGDLWRQAEIALNE